MSLIGSSFPYSFSRTKLIVSSLSRLDVLKTRQRSSSPAADSRGESKRLAMRCEFFARGWCIKGNSCRFLHIKDHVTSHDKDGGLDDTMIKSKLADGKGNPDP